MTNRTALATALALPIALGACAANSATFEPAPGAQPAPAAGGAVATDAGVRVVAEGNAWTGRPASLDQKLTPFRVHVTNNSTHQLLVRFRDFRLVTPTGETYFALPPFQIDKQVTRTITPAYPYTGFAVAPYLSPYYPDLTAADPFLFDEPYYSTYWPIIQQIELPTVDMVDKALPAGVLEPGGTVSGFVYFQHVDPKAARVRLVIDLPRASTHEDFGKVEIPFVVH